MHEPSFIVSDPNDASNLSMIGRYNGKGSIIRFNKRDGQIDWVSQFEQMSSIQAVSQSDSGDTYLCGHHQPDDATTTGVASYHAVIARIFNEGQVDWIISASGEHPLAETGTSSAVSQDKCVGISYDRGSEQIAVVI